MRETVKKLTRYIAAIIISPFILFAWIGRVLFRTEAMFTFCGQLISMIPDPFGIFFRVAYYMFTIDQCPYDGHIMFGAIISKKNTKIGRNYIIGVRSILGLVEIGDNTAIAHDVHIMSGRRQHNFENTDKSIIDGDSVFTCTHIGHNVFIGNGCIIMADIGDYCIIGAGSVVVNPIPPYSVAAGNPAKVIKSRK